MFHYKGDNSFVAFIMKRRQVFMFKDKGGKTLCRLYLETAAGVPESPARLS